MRASIKNIGIKFQRLGVALDRLVELFFIEIGCAQVAVERTRIVFQRDRLLILPDRAAIITSRVISNPEIVVGVSMVAVRLDGAFETLSRLFIALQLELADPDLIEHRSVLRRAFQGGLVELDGVEKVLVFFQLVATLLEFSGRCSRGWWIDAVQWRRPNFHLFRILGSQGKNQKRSEKN